MNTRMILMGSLSALVLGGSVVGCTAGGGQGLASASSLDARANVRAAAVKAEKAGKLLAKHDGISAIDLAEGAVALAPRDAGYRFLLGQSYLQAGRFASARTAFADTLQLEPKNGKAALNLALAQIATGDWAAARETLGKSAGLIPAADHGLALALAGDPAGAVSLLTQVVRSPETTAKARQNLALALALAGQWQGARVVASTDMNPAEVDQRLQEWAVFAQPHGAADQVASLLGIKPMADHGQPVALALNAPVAVADTGAVLASAPVAPAMQPVEVASAAPAIVFGPRQEIVQSLPAALARTPSAGLIRADASPIKVALVGGKAVAVRAPAAAKAAPASGNWFVQIGAFDSAGVARDAWGRATRRLPTLAQHGPSGTVFRVKAGQFYRLSVGGFARGEADALCRTYRARGGACFVRNAAGDQRAEWTKKSGVQLAAR